MKWEEIHAIEQKDPLWHHVVYLLETINKIKPDATALAVIWLIQGSLFLSQNIQKEENTFQQQNIFAHSSDFFVQQISAVS
ncbi:hypothetical protein GW750_09625 [bacterium]|nr:hypothetical protein [bacterium]